MQQRQFGSTNRLVSVIGQGTSYPETTHYVSPMAALRIGLDAGMTYIDTDESYPGVEEIVAKAIVGRRPEAFLISKVMPYHASRAGTITACERSLRRLRTDHLDCYVLNGRGPHPLAETIEAFEQLRTDGKIAAWGVCNFTLSDLEEALKIAGEGHIACSQVSYHLQDRAIEHTILPWCETHNVAVVATNPYAHGNFPGPDTAGGRILQIIADAHQATARQVALRFLVRHPSTFAIPTALIHEHAAENAGAGTLELSEAELEQINNAFPLPSLPQET